MINNDKKMAILTRLVKDGSIDLEEASILLETATTKFLDQTPFEPFDWETRNQSLNKFRKAI